MSYEAIEQYGPDERPEGISGILQTKNYETFMILDDTGLKIHEFEGAKLSNKCLPGDHVRWDLHIEKCVLELRDEHPPIVGTLELTNKSRYGMTSRGIPIYLFTPYSKRYPQFIVGSSEKDISVNKIALVKFDTWEKNSTFPRGQLQQILGNSGYFEAEKHALIWQASPWKYPKGPWEPKTKESHIRESLQGYTFNIDPEGCKDIDDVLTFHKIPEGWQITITISDVARYIEDGSLEDIFASLIEQTLYIDGMMVRPMLPEEYSENVCSLLPNKESYGISLSFIWNGTQILDTKWFESTVVNNISYTYTEFEQANTPYKQPLKEVTSFLAGEEINDSHKWIEECMKFYNTEAGKLLKSIKNGILRKHSAPNLEKFKKYEKIMPDLKKLAYSSAEYCLAEDSETIHHGLNTDSYAHTSSPIRRYADLVNQRIIKSILQGTLQKDNYIIPIAMYDMNRRQKEIKMFERDYIFLNALYNKEKRYSCTIIDIIHYDNDIHTIKVRLYVKEWNKIISCKYKSIDSLNISDDESTILSRDEKRELIIHIGDNREIECTWNINARNWKDRIIVNLF